MGEVMAMIGGIIAKEPKEAQESIWEKACGLGMETAHQ